MFDKNRLGGHFGSSCVCVKADETALEHKYPAGGSTYLQKRKEDHD
jgi:hypothetical protein